MIEKRFDLVDGCICDDKTPIDKEYVTDLLNEFWEDLLFWKKVASQRADEIKETIKLQEDLDYYKTKSGSLETGLIQAQRQNKQLTNTLQKHYDFANKRMTETIDNVIVHNCYGLLKSSIIEISNELGVELND